MADGGAGGGKGEGEPVVELEDAVKLLVEHLVQPVLPRSANRREAALAPEKQEAVARQVRLPSFARGCSVRGAWRKRGGSGFRDASELATH